MRETADLSGSCDCQPQIRHGAEPIFTPDYGAQNARRGYRHQRSTRWEKQKRDERELNQGRALSCFPFPEHAAVHMH